MTNETDYAVVKKEIEGYLAGLGVTWDIRLIGDSCPIFCKDKGKLGIGAWPRKTHVHGQHYQMTLRRSVGTETHPKNAVTVVDYWNSYHDAMINCAGLVEAQFAAGQTRIARYLERKNARNVTVADILGCCEFYAAETFEEFAAEFGYEEDSRQAEKVYEAVRKQVADFRRMFTKEELETIQEKVREL